MDGHDWALLYRGTKRHCLHNPVLLFSFHLILFYSRIVFHALYQPPRWQVGRLAVLHRQTYQQRLFLGAGMVSYHACMWMPSSRRPLHPLAPTTYTRNRHGRTASKSPAEPTGQDKTKPRPRCKCKNKMSHARNIPVSGRSLRPRSIAILHAPFLPDAAPSWHLLCRGTKRLLPPSIMHVISSAIHPSSFPPTFALQAIYRRRIHPGASYIFLSSVLSCVPY